MTAAGTNEGLVAPSISAPSRRRGRALRCVRNCMPLWVPGARPHNGPWPKGWMRR